MKLYDRVVNWFKELEVPEAIKKVLPRTKKSREQIALIDTRTSFPKATTQVPNNRTKTVIAKFPIAVERDNLDDKICSELTENGKSNLFWNAIDANFANSTYDALFSLAAIDWKKKSLETIASRTRNNEELIATNIRSAASDVFEIKYNEYTETYQTLFKAIRQDITVLFHEIYRGGNEIQHELTEQFLLDLVKPIKTLNYTKKEILLLGTKIRKQLDNESEKYIGNDEDKCKSTIQMLQTAVSTYFENLIETDLIKNSLTEMKVEVDLVAKISALTDEGARKEERIRELTRENERLTEANKDLAGFEEARARSALITELLYCLTDNKTTDLIFKDMILIEKYLPNDLQQKLSTLRELKLELVDYQKIKDELTKLKTTTADYAAKTERLTLLEELVKTTKTITDYKTEINSPQQIIEIREILNQYKTANDEQKTTAAAIDKLKAVAKKEFISTTKTPDKYDTKNPAELIDIIATEITKISKNYQHEKTRAAQSLETARELLITIYGAENAEKKAEYAALSEAEVWAELKTKTTAKDQEAKSLAAQNTKAETKAKKYITTMRTIAKTTSRNITVEETEIDALKEEELEGFITEWITELKEKYQNNKANIASLYFTLKTIMPNTITDLETKVKSNDGITAEEVTTRVNTIIEEYASYQQMQRTLLETIDTTLKSTEKSDETKALTDYTQLSGITLAEKITEKVTAITTAYATAIDEQKTTTQQITDLTEKVRKYQQMLDKDGTLQTAIEQAITPAAIVDYLYTALEQHSFGVYTRDKSGKDASAFVNPAYLALLKGETVPAADDIASGTDATLTDIIDGTTVTINPALYLKDPVTKEGCDGSVRVVIPQQFMDAVATAIKARVIEEYMRIVTETITKKQ